MIPSINNPLVLFGLFVSFALFFLWVQMKENSIVEKSSSSLSLSDPSTNNRITMFNASSRTHHCLQHVKLNGEEKNLVDSMNAFGMSAPERWLLFNVLQESDFYFEFGCGGSTVAACNFGGEYQQVVSVDSSKEWLLKVADDSCLQQPLNTARFTQIYIDIGELKAFGFPKTSDKVSSYHTYSEAIIPYGKEVDLVLVDGRFRVACVLQSLLSTRPGTDILIHDFFNRPIYYVVLKYVDVVDCADTLVVVRLKPSADRAAIQLELVTYVNNPE